MEGEFLAMAFGGFCGATASAVVVIALLARGAFDRVMTMNRMLRLEGVENADGALYVGRDGSRILLAPRQQAISAPISGWDGGGQHG